MILKFIDKLFNQHKIARRAALTWAMSIITITILAFLEMAPKLPGADKVFIAIIGILATVIAFYQWSRSNDSSDK